MMQILNYMDYEGGIYLKNTMSVVFSRLLTWSGFVIIYSKCILPAAIAFNIHVF